MAENRNETIKKLSFKSFILFQNACFQFIFCGLNLTFFKKRKEERISKDWLIQRLGPFKFLTLPFLWEKNLMNKWNQSNFQSFSILWVNGQPIAFTSRKLIDAIQNWNQLFVGKAMAGKRLRKPIIYEWCVNRHAMLSTDPNKQQQ